MRAIPINEHQSRGTYRPDRHKAAPLVPIAAPPAPKWMSTPEKKKWREVARLLADAGIITTLDLDSLAGFVVSYTSWQTELALLRVEGSTYEHGGLKKTNPRVLVAQSALRDALAWAREIGLTLGSRRRNRIELAKPVASDKERFFGKVS